MAKSKATHVISHPSVYLRGAKGKLEQQEVGKELVLSKSQGESMEKKGFVKSVKDAKTQDLSDGGDLKKAEKLLEAAKTLMAEAETLKGESASELEAAKTLMAEAETLKGESASELEAAKTLMAEAETLAKKSD